MNRYWSNQLNCKLCGFTNRWFPIHKNTINGRIFFSKLKTCVECRSEKTKQAGIKYRKSDKGKDRQKRYDLARIEQRRKMYRVYRKRYVAKMKASKNLLALRARMFGKQMI